MVAENLLQLLETAGPEALSTVLRDQGPQAEEALAAVVASGYPDRSGITELEAVAEHTLRKPASGIGHRRTRRSHSKIRKGGRRCR